MTTVLKTLALIVFISILIWALASMSREADAGHGLCVSGKIIGPCDQWPLKDIPNVKLSDGDKDKKRP